MARFKFDVTIVNDTVRWALAGDINEHAIIPEMDQTKSLIINLKNVTTFNSYGVKLWSQWMRVNKDAVSIVLEECPYSMVQNMGMVQGLINDNTFVNSFFVPFINESGTEVKQILFTIGKEFQADGTLVIPTILDSAGEPMEADVNPKNYFSFLKRQSFKSEK